MKRFCSEMACCVVELKKIDFTTLITRRGGVDKKGPGSLGQARCRDRVILDGRVWDLCEGEGLETYPQKGESRKEMARDGRCGKILL